MCVCVCVLPPHEQVTGRANIGRVINREKSECYRKTHTHTRGRGLGLSAGVADAAGRDAVVDALAVLEVEAGAHARLARGVVGRLGRGRGGLLAHLNAGLFGVA